MLRSPMLASSRTSMEWPMKVLLEMQGRTTTRPSPSHPGINRVRIQTRQSSRPMIQLRQINKQWRNCRSQPSPSGKTSSTTTLQRSAAQARLLWLRTRLSWTISSPTSRHAKQSSSRCWSGMTSWRPSTRLIPTTHVPKNEANSRCETAADDTSGREESCGHLRRNTPIT